VPYVKAYRIDDGNGCERRRVIRHRRHRGAGTTGFEIEDLVEQFEEILRGPLCRHRAHTGAQIVLTVFDLMHDDVAKAYQRAQHAHKHSRNVPDVERLKSNGLGQRALRHDRTGQSQDPAFLQTNGRQGIKCTHKHRSNCQRESRAVE
jgi:hypothetical protein